MKPRWLNSLVLCLGAVACARVSTTHAQLTNFSVLHSFGYPQQSGYIPSGPVTAGRDGTLYGTTYWGGSYYSGTVYQVGRDGRGYAVVRHFGRSGVPDGDWPVGSVLEGSDGMLYGTTEQNSDGGISTVFRMASDGNDFTILHTFGPYQSMKGMLFEDSDGAIYGAFGHDASSLITGIFKLRKDGSGFSAPPSLIGATGLMEGSDGALYGTRGQIVFRMNRQTLAATVLHQFGSNVTDGADPVAVREGRDGMLYGTTYSGGAADGGSIFRLNKNGSGYQVLHSFGTVPGDSIHPDAGVVEDEAGILYGMVGSVAYKVNRDGTDFAVLHRFTGENGDGERPYSRLAVSGDGVYGTTQWGGLYGGEPGIGTLFRLRSGGATPDIIWHFREWFGGDGIDPVALVEGTDGNLYMATQPRDEPRYSGRLVRSSRDGAEYAVLRDLWPGGALWGGVSLIEGSDTRLYGINHMYWEHSELFGIDRDGANHTLLHRFFDDEQTADITYGVIEASDGAFYGTTTGNGSYVGTLYRTAKPSGDHQVLRYFDYFHNGSSLPSGAALLEGSDGRLYGTTTELTPVQGGIFAVNKDGTGYTELHRFSGAPADGETAHCILIEGSDGRIYGSTYSGGMSNVGTLFAMDRNGSNYVVIHHFTGSRGVAPYDGVLEGRDGALYGISYAGFAWAHTGRGALFKIQKDGSGFRLLSQGGDLRKLIRGSDGAFYGFSAAVGDVDFGALFRFGHALNLEHTPGRARLHLTGIAGYSYELQRSGDLVHWTTLQTVLMPDGLVVEYEDNPTLTGAAFYRLRVP